MSIIKSIQTQLADSEYVAGVFDDFKKTFDTVEHDVLIEKLDHDGVREAAKDWFVLT